jgi:AbrB family looped-hinge helix DNA binding protein
MPKVTSKLQVTVPKALAERFGIKPGDEIRWETAGAVIRVIPAHRLSHGPSVEDRVKAFDRATARQRSRQGTPRRTGRATARGWRRQDLYVRAQPG